MLMKKIEIELLKVTDWVPHRETPGIEDAQFYVGATEKMNFLVGTFFLNTADGAKTVFRGYDGTATIAGSVIVRLSPELAQLGVEQAQKMLEGK
jgi:hypothetical protein